MSRKGEIENKIVYLQSKIATESDIKELLRTEDVADDVRQLLLRASANLTQDDLDELLIQYAHDIVSILCDTEKKEAEAEAAKLSSEKTDQMKVILQSKKAMAYINENNDLNDESKHALFIAAHCVNNNLPVNSDTLQKVSTVLTTAQLPKDVEYFSDIVVTRNTEIAKSIKNYKYAKFHANLIEKSVKARVKKVDKSQDEQPKKPVDEIASKSIEELNSDIEDDDIQSSRASLPKKKKQEIKKGSIPVPVMVVSVVVALGLAAYFLFYAGSEENLDENASRKSGKINLSPVAVKMAAKMMEKINMPSVMPANIMGELNSSNMDLEALTAKAQQIQLPDGAQNPQLPDNANTMMTDQQSGSGSNQLNMQKDSRKSAKDVIKRNQEITVDDLTRINSKLLDLDTAESNSVNAKTTLADIDNCPAGYRLLVTQQLNSEERYCYNQDENFIVQKKILDKQISIEQYTYHRVNRKMKLKDVQKVQY